MMTKFLTISIFKNKKIVGVVGLANKEADYDEADIINITLFMEAVWTVTDSKKAEQALAESEERFRALHNASFGGIAIHDQGAILECNQGLTDMTQYSRDELIGMDGLLLIAPEDRQLVGKNIATGYEKSYEAFGQRKNGEIFPMRLTGRNIPYKGKTVRVVEFGYYQRKGSLCKPWKPIDGFRMRLLSVNMLKKHLEPVKKNLKLLLNITGWHCHFNPGWGRGVCDRKILFNVGACIG